MKRKRDKAVNADVDPRFAAARTNPRFQRFPKSQRTVDIDDRFAGMFKDKAFQVRSAVDKRGRKLGKAKRKEDMQKYYRLQDPEEEELNDLANKTNTKGESPEDDRGDGKAENGRPKKGSKARESQDVAKGKSSKRPGPGAKAGKLGSKLPAATQSSEDEDEEKEDSMSEEDGFEDEQERRAAERWARVRGLAGPDSSSSSSSGSEEDSEAEALDGVIQSDDEDIDLAEWGVGAMAGNPDEQVPEVQEETSRLAVLDLDWSKVKAADILAMLQSFLRKGQRIDRVTVYPSDYGLERMAEEAKFGPKGLASTKGSEPAKTAKESQEWGSTLSKEQRAAVLEALNEQVSDDEDAEGPSHVEPSTASSEDEDSGDMQAGLQDEATDGSSGSETDDEVARRRLQLYERSRLRYYYAIAECADVATARHLYSECDGMEFEHSASLFDLRYVPEDQDFSQRQVRETATSVPLGYKPPEVGIAAMLHTKPKLTWDAEEEGRKRMLHKRVSKEELRDDDFKAYLGSESDDNEQPEQEKKAAGERYRQLLTGATGTDQHQPEESDEADVDNDGQGVKDEGDQQMEMEVTFGGGLGDLSQRLKTRLEAKVNKKNDTVWQAYLRKREERRKRAKARGQKADDDEDDAVSDDSRGEQDPYFKHSENAFDDPFFNDANGDAEDQGGSAIETGKKATKSAARQKKLEKAAADGAERRRKAQLELLLMDDRKLQDAVKLGAGVALDNSHEEDGHMPRQKLSKKARLAAKKAEKRASRGAASDEEDIQPGDQGSKFQMDMADKRFDALFTSPDFALDPTDPRYKSSEATKSIQKEAAGRKGKPQRSKPREAPKPEQKALHNSNKQGDSRESHSDVKNLIASLKRKSQAKGKKIKS